MSAESVPSLAVQRASSCCCRSAACWRKSRINGPVPRALNQMQELLEFVVDDVLYSADLALALLAVGGDDLFEVVDVE